MSEAEHPIPSGHEAQRDAESSSDNSQPSHWEEKSRGQDEDPSGHAPGPQPSEALTLHAGGAGPVRAEPPVDLTVRVGAKTRVAGGFQAIAKTMEHGFSKMGPVRATKTLLRLNQKGGFDCQSCAWPDEDGHRDAAAFCESGAKAVADEGMTKRVTPEFFAAHSVAELSAQSDHWLNAQGRLTHPMVLREGATHYTPLSWDEAFALIGKHLLALGSPDEASFYTSGRASNEAAFVYQTFVRELGTNNLPDCSNMCHESSGSALTASIGIGKGTVKLEDFEKAELILILGQNPGTNHPRMLTALQKAKRAGAYIISANPLPETGLMRFKHPQEVGAMLFGKGTVLTDQFLQVRINSDLELMLGMMKRLFELEDEKPGSALDRTFIHEQTQGFEDLEAKVRGTPWEDVVAKTGVTRAEIAAAGDKVAASKRIIACWAMGLTQHRNSVLTIQQVVNLLLLRGAIGKPGAGVCPVRGHSNVQGDRTVGVWERPREPFLTAMDKEFGFKSPRPAGRDVVETIRGMHEGKVKLLFGLGGNFLSATPDTNYTAEALGKTELTAHVSTKLNRGHLVTGKVGVILPCLGRSEVDRQASGEQMVSTENSMGVVQMSEGRNPPASAELRSEVAIVCGLARATLGLRSRVAWEKLEGNYDLIRDHIEHVIPGFERYNERVREQGGFYLPNLPREGIFPTASKKAHFIVGSEQETPALAEGQLLLMTIRSHDQFNTTIYGLDDRYRGIYGGRRVVFLNPEDAAARGLKAGDSVDLTSHFQGVQRHAQKFLVVPYSIPRRCAAAYFPETNVLVPVDSVALKSNTPTSKSIVITLTPSPNERGLARGEPQPGRRQLPEP